MSIKWWRSGDEDQVMKIKWWRSSDEDQVMKIMWWGSSDEDQVMRIFFLLIFDIGVILPVTSSSDLCNIFRSSRCSFRSLKRFFRTFLIFDFTFFVFWSLYPFQFNFFGLFIFSSSLHHQMTSSLRHHVFTYWFKSWKFSPKFFSSINNLILGSNNKSDIY